MSEADAALAAWLAPQERADSLRTLAASHGSRFCDLAYANPHGVPEPVRAALASALGASRRLDFQYTPYGGATIARRHAARDLTASHGLAFGWRNLVLTPGAMAALQVAFRSVLRAAGDEVVVVTPCWIDVPLYLAHLGLRPVLVPVRSEDLHLDLPAIEKALGPRTRALVLAQPANPSGVLYGAGELAALAELLARRPEPPVLISDECHRDFCSGERGFVSPVAVYDDTLVVYSFGKRWSIQGQRIGYVAVSPRCPDAAERVQRLERLCRVQGFATPTALMQLALPALLEVPADTAALLPRRTRSVARLRDAGYELAAPDATFFLYPRTPYGDDFRFAESLAGEGVLVLPAPVFHHAGHFRISLTTPDDVLDRALDVLAARREP